MAQITASELSRHKSRKDLWLVIHGKVYNVSKFLEDHPGGEDVLLEHAGIALSDEIVGTDASELFEDFGHSAAARELLTKYYIGEYVVEGTESILHHGLHLPYSNKKGCHHVLIIGLSL